MAISRAAASRWHSRLYAAVSLSLGRGGHSREPGQSPDQGRQIALDLGVCERPGCGQHLVSAGDRELLLEHLGADRPQHLARLRLRADRAVAPRAGPHHRGGLVRENALARGPGGPVERVLEHAGNRAVVLGGGDEDRAGRVDPPPEIEHRTRRPLTLQVLVEVGDRAELSEDLEADTRGSERRRPFDQAQVERVPSQAAGYPQHGERSALHRDGD